MTDTERELNSTLAELTAQQEANERLRDQNAAQARKIKNQRKQLRQLNLAIRHRSLLLTETRHLQRRIDVRRVEEIRRVQAINETLRQENERLHAEESKRRRWRK